MEIMEIKDLIIEDIVNAKFFDDNVINEKLLRSNYYKWFSNEEKSIIVIISESDEYEIEESNSHSLTINCDDFYGQFIEFTKNYLVIYQEGLGESELIMSHNVVFDNTKWKYIDSNEGYYIWYKKINDTYVWIID